VRLSRLAIHGFRNLADGVLDVPSRGFALVGRNGQGKTNLLEAAYYPVLLRSFRGAADAELVAFGGTGFHVEAAFEGESTGQLAATFVANGKKKRITVADVEERRLTAAIGRWLAVVFLPGDVELAGGPAVERRRFLDRMLSLAEPAYLRALLRYRGALARRNAALRQQQGDVARACEPILATEGALLVARRVAWVRGSADAFGRELAGLSEPGHATLRYSGRPELASVEAWGDTFAGSFSADRARGMTTIGPHRDDVVLAIDDQPLRVFGSTGQLRSAAIALKLLELATLREQRGVEPALLLDDVFAELDSERQRQLAARLMGDGQRQLFVTAPRRDELPAQLDLPRWDMDSGRARPGGESA
jgi:DNA replication and repair protein RecF